MPWGVAGGLDHLKAFNDVPIARHSRTPDRPMGSVGEDALEEYERALLWPSITEAPNPTRTSCGSGYVRYFGFTAEHRCPRSGVRLRRTGGMVVVPMGDDDGANISPLCTSGAKAQLYVRPTAVHTGIDQHPPGIGPGANEVAARQIRPSTKTPQPIGDFFDHKIVHHRTLPQPRRRQSQGLYRLNSVRPKSGRSPWPLSWVAFVAFLLYALTQFSI